MPYSETGTNRPVREAFEDSLEGLHAYAAAYVQYLKYSLNLEDGDRILTTAHMSIINPSRWNKGSDRARGG